MAVERWQAVVGEQLLLRGDFTYDNDKTLFDPYEISKVDILAADKTTIKETILPPNIIRDSKGNYHVITSASWNDTPGSFYDEWHYKMTDGGTPLTGLNPISISAAGSPGTGDCRKGFMFCNPDTSANNGWGAILTPDELRYVYAFGNDLVAPNADTFSDCTLQWYIDSAIGHVERDLNVNLMKRIFKHVDAPGETRDKSTWGEEGIDFEYQDPYDFYRKEFQEFIWIKLRHRPIIEVNQVTWRDVSGEHLVDMTTEEWVKVNKEKGSIQMFPGSGSLESLPIYLGQTFAIGRMMTAIRNYPDAFFIDYDAGFKSAAVLRKKWPELFPIVGKLASINLLAEYGDGKTAALASSSIGLAGISESFSTTLSATSAAFGARIKQYTEDIKAFYKLNKNKYAGILIGSL